MVVDYHTHTHFSPDANYSMGAMCAAALAAGLSEIAFTDHADFEPTDETTGYLDLPAYIDSLRRYQREYSGQLTVRAGIELGDPHNYADQHSEILGEFDFDFVIGSIHWVNGRCTCSARFFEGVNPRDAYSEYYAAALVAAETGDFDVMGHLDVPKRRGEHFVSGLDPRLHEDQIRKILRQLAAAGRGIEINTSGLRSPATEPCPSLEIVRWFREEAGKIVTIGSDAHWPGQIGFAGSAAVAMLRAAGFRHLTTFEGRKPVFIPI